MRPWKAGPGRQSSPEELTLKIAFQSSIHYHPSAMGEMQELPFTPQDEGLDEAPSEIPIYTVSQLNALVRELLEVSFPEVWVKGEISNFRSYPSGHLYFTLKDGSSEIQAVMFQSLAAQLDFQPEDGMNVLAYGSVTVYERRGRYQLEVKRLKPAGLGRLQLAFERLKERLKAEGLFDEIHKRPIPKYPERIGVITSTEGAAIRDMISIVSRRYPLVELLIFPVKVQGEGAAEEIAQAIGLANRYHLREPIDVLIVGRGGGSMEDLWAFNEEIVARAIFHSAIPIVSAVGHEIDFTIADFVADMRAPTPSAAAELVVPRRDDLLGQVSELLRRLAALQRARLEDHRLRLKMLTSSYAFRRPIRSLSEHRQTLDHLSELLIRAFRVRKQALEERLRALLGRLEAVSPLAVLSRGYAVVEDQSGRVVKSAAQVKLHERLSVRLHRGRLSCEVLEKHEDPHDPGDQA